MDKEEEETERTQFLMDLVKKAASPKGSPKKGGAPPVTVYEPPPVTVYEPPASEEEREAAVEEEIDQAIKPNKKGRE